MTTMRLERSRDKVIGGVSGGLANYLGVDPVLIRVAFVLLTLFGGGGVLIYVVMWTAIPAEAIDYKAAFSKSDTNVATGQATTEVPPVKKNQSNTALIAGVILIILGLLFLADRLIPFYNLRDFWPVILIVTGILVMKPDLLKGTSAAKNADTVNIKNDDSNTDNNQDNTDSNSNNQETKNS